MSKNVKNKSKSEKSSKQKSESKLSLFIRKYSYYIIIISGFLAYFQCINFDFSYFDDKDYLIKNVSSVGGLSHFDEAFKRDAFFAQSGSEFYRPVQSLTLMLDYDLGGSKPWIFHFTNILMHLINCSLILYLLLNLGFDHLKSLFLTILFTLNPLISHTVAWIPARGDMLVSIFSILTFVFYLKYNKSNEKKYLVLAFITFFGAVFSKEIAVLIPILIMIFHFLNKTDKKSNKSFIFLLSGFTLVLIIFFIFRSNVIKNFSPTQVLGIQSILFNIPVLSELVSKFIIPFNLNPMPKFNTFTTMIGFLLIMVMLVGMILSKNANKKIMLFGLIFYLFLILPTLIGRHNLGDQAYDYLEHRAYLPLLGIIIYLSELIRNIKLKENQIVSIGIVIILISTIITENHIRIYSEPLTFYNYIIDNGSKISLAYHNRGFVRREQNDFQGAFDDFNTALSLKPDYSSAYNNRGVTYGMTNNFKSAYNDFDIAIKFKPDNYEAFANRGNANHALGNVQAACSDWKFAAEHGNQGALKTMEMFCK